MTDTVSRRILLQRAAAAMVVSGELTFASERKAQASMAADRPTFEPTWDSLAQYRTPDWFRDAKFGMWAHWGPQCVPEQGDWYARSMYEEGSHNYKYQCDHYGHPSKAGFKDVIHAWRADAWDPEHLISLYKRAGARYFMALANHHDNFDNYDSKYQPWNSVAQGPKRDLVGGWEKAARRAGLRFAVSVHAAHAWSWYEVAQGADKTGPLAGVPYDGKLTRADGKGQWWDGLDPQDLYAQSHTPGAKLVWEWNASQGSSVPDAAYCEKFYKRTIDLIDNYRPDLVYFDDTVLPLYPVSDAGLRIAAYAYNASIRRHGRNEAVVTGKVLNEMQRRCLVWDLERGASDRIEPLPWQTDTCIGNWHYDRGLFERHGYKTPKQVVQMLLDIVSKNGNLMLNIPLPGSGMPDSDALAFIADFTKWMDVGSEGIYASRPWRVFGEGPAGGGPAVKAQGFNEGVRHYTAQDFRFMCKGRDLYAYALAWPDDGQLKITSLATGNADAPKVRRVTLLGAGKAPFTQDATGLTVTLPQRKPCDYAYGLKIEGEGLTAPGLT